MNGTVYKKGRLFELRRANRYNGTPFEKGSVLLLEDFTYSNAGRTLVLIALDNGSTEIAHVSHDLLRIHCVGFMP